MNMFRKKTALLILAALIFSLFTGSIFYLNRNSNQASAGWGPIGNGKEMAKGEIMVQDIGSKDKIYSLNCGNHNARQLSKLPYPILTNQKGDRHTSNGLPGYFNNTYRQDWIFQINHLSNYNPPEIYFINSANNATIRINQQESNPSWVIKAVGDFNGDNFDDLAWRNVDNGENRIWFIKGGEVIGQKSIFNVSDKNWEMQAAGDVDNDGKAELLWRHKTTDENAIWKDLDSDKMRGIWMPKVITRFNDPEMTFLGVADCDNDGKNEIVWWKHGWWQGGRNYSLEYWKLQPFDTSDQVKVQSESKILNMKDVFRDTTEQDLYMIKPFYSFNVRGGA
jgi:FG-GAP-like repeat